MGFLEFKKQPDELPKNMGKPFHNIYYYNPKHAKILPLCIYLYSSILYHCQGFAIKIIISMCKNTDSGKSNCLYKSLSKSKPSVLENKETLYMYIWN